MSNGSKSWFSRIGKILPGAWRYVEKRAPNVKTSRWLAKKQLQRETRAERKAVESRTDRVKKVVHEKTEPLFKKLDQSAGQYNRKVNYASSEFNDAARGPGPAKTEKPIAPSPGPKAAPTKEAWVKSSPKQEASKPKAPAPAARKVN